MLWHSLLNCYLVSDAAIFALLDATDESDIWFLYKGSFLL